MKKAPVKLKQLSMPTTGMMWPRIYLSVYIQAEHTLEEQMLVEMFARARCGKARRPEDADLVVFGGGEDVSPCFYNHEAVPETHSNFERDLVDLSLFGLCVEKGIPMFGLCRGAQLLHVGHGGTLYQDVNKHQGQHEMFDLDGRCWITTSSVHHQACQIPQPPDKHSFELLATASESTQRRISPTSYSTGKMPDVEAFMYHDTCTFGTQGHPEYSGYPDYSAWVLNKLQDIIGDPRFATLKHNNYRVPDEVLANRKPTYWETTLKKKVLKELNKLQTTQEVV